jgi:hypothetical protein
MVSSERIVVAAPMSYTGSATRIWRWSPNAWIRWGLLTWVVLLAWTTVTVWYAAFGLLLVPYRLVRRGQRRRHLEDARHEEVLRRRTTW